MLRRNMFMLWPVELVAENAVEFSGTCLSSFFLQQMKHEVPRILRQEFRSVFFSDKLLGYKWAELKGGAGKTYRRAKPHKDGPLETVFGQPPKAVSEGVT